ncbi:MAG: type 2 isopentenyl-diphosphate Delta-isomerase [bacterium]
MDPTILRKLEHIRICLEEDVELGESFLDDVTLMHQCLPEQRLEDVDTSSNFLGKRLELPLVIAALTGGCQEAEPINRALAAVAARTGIAFGVGSQRAMLETPALLPTFSVRDVAPDILLLGNLGITAIRKYPPEKVHEAVRAIGADALCVHINAAQELFQAEGDVDFGSCSEALRALCREAPYPVIAKEVGCGISRESALALQASGVSAIDVGGRGGTSWVLVDSIRSGRDATRFLSWGIPTAVSLLEARAAALPLIATGGVRNGLQMANAIRLGADVCGIALPFLRVLHREGEEGLERYVNGLKRDFSFALYLTGAKNVAEFRTKGFVLGSRILQWAQQRCLPLPMLSPAPL